MPSSASWGGAGRVAARLAVLVEQCLEAGFAFVGGQSHSSSEGSVCHHMSGRTAGIAEPPGRDQARHLGNCAGGARTHRNASLHGGHRAGGPGDPGVRARPAAARSGAARRSRAARRNSRPRLAQTVTAEGLGGPEALRLFDEVLSNGVRLGGQPAVSRVHSRRADRVGHAVRPGGRCLVDLRRQWLEGAGAVYAENQALRWIADLAGMPEGAGGCFVSGGTHRQPVRPGRRPAHAGRTRRRRARRAADRIDEPRRTPRSCPPRR